jgi:hypothetical protein
MRASADFNQSIDWVNRFAGDFDDALADTLHFDQQIATSTSKSLIRLSSQSRIYRHLFFWLSRLRVKVPGTADDRCCRLFGWLPPPRRGSEQQVALRRSRPVR